MLYDLIIIGSGAAGLFAGASLSSPVNGLIIDKSSTPGKKLLMSGGGQCNITHGGSIKDFIHHYGNNGNKIRSILYNFNNKDVMDFFEIKGIPLFKREDGKIFPQSLRAKDILDILVRCCSENGLKFIFSSPVTNIKKSESGDFQVICGNSVYATKKLIVASGGCSYPSTGSDGSLMPILENLGIGIKPLKPALAPIYVHDYPYTDLAGISFANAKVSIRQQQTDRDTSKANSKSLKQTENTDALLFTHTCFSGPAILNLSRNTCTGDGLTINYYTKKLPEILLKELKDRMPGNQKQIITVLYEYLNPNLTDSAAEVPKRFIELICERCGIDHTRKFSQLSGKELTAIIGLITADCFVISHTGGFNTAMVTSGGIDLDEVNLKIMESKKIPGMYFAGEVLNIDGDTGGYNLQFAFSSGYLAASRL